MPLYLYQHPETEELIEVVQNMKDEHVYIDDVGTQWSRVFTSPNAAMDSCELDPYSSSDFIKATNKKGMTNGEMWDLSKEMSNKRKRKGGKDKIKEKAVKEYEKKCNKPHPNKGKRLL